MNERDLQSIELKYLASCAIAEAVSKKVALLRERMKEQTQAVRALTQQIKHHRTQKHEEPISAYQIINLCVPPKVKGDTSG